MVLSSSIVPAEDSGISPLLRVGANVKTTSSGVSLEFSRVVGFAVRTSSTELKMISVSSVTTTPATKPMPKVRGDSLSGLFGILLVAVTLGYLMQVNEPPTLSNGLSEGHLRARHALLGNVSLNYM